MKKWLRGSLMLVIMMVLALNLGWAKKDKILTKLKLKPQKIDNTTVTQIKKAVKVHKLNNFDIKDGEKIILNENFDGGVFPPSGWTANTGDADWDNVTDIADHTTGSGKYARYDCYDISGGDEGYLITPALTPDAANHTLDFWVNYYLIEGAYGNAAELYVDISTDGGTNWTNGVTNIIDGQHGAGWFEHTEDLSAYIGQSIQVRFRAISDYGSYDIAVDDVSGVSLPDTYPPAIAYAKVINRYNNDPIPITASVDDPSGVQSVNLKYSTDGTNFTTIPMNLKADYTATIPGQSFGTQVYFKIEATDNAATPNTGETALESFMVENPTDLFYDDGSYEQYYWFGAGTLFGPIVKFDFTGNTLINTLQVATSGDDPNATLVIYDDISKNKSHLLYSKNVNIVAGMNTIPVNFVTTGTIYAGIQGSGVTGFGCDTDSDQGVGYFYFGPDDAVYPNSGGGISGNWSVRLNVENYFDNNISVNDVTYPQTIYPGDKVNISVLVQNKGANAQANIPVELALAKNGKTIFSKTVYTTGILQPLASQVVTLDWTAIAGDPITATATATLATDEWPTNNTLAKTFTVADYVVAGVPLNESFEGGVFPPSGWTANTGDAAWDQSNQTVDHTSGSGKYARYNCYNISDGDEGYLITPALTPDAANHTLDFWVNYYLKSGTWGNSSELYVDISTNDGATWTALTGNIIDGQHGAGWLEHTEDLSAYNGQSIQVRFRAISDYGSYNIAVDDVTGPAITSTLPKPNDLALTNITRPASGNDYTIDTNIPLSVSVLNKGASNQSGVNVTCELTRLSNAKGEDDNIKADYTFTSTVADINSTVSHIFDINVNVPVSGLYQATIYHSIAPDDVTNNDTLEFKTVIYQRATDEGTYITLFGESFELPEFPQGWTYQNNFGILQTANPHIGDKYVAANSQDYLITPKINLPVGKLYRVTFYYSTSNHRKLSVKASQNTKDLNDFNIDLLPETDLASNDYYQMKVDIKNGANYLTGDLYLGFFAGDGEGDLRIDDIVVKEIIPNDMQANDILEPDMLALAAEVPMQFTGVVENVGTDNLSNKTLHLYITSTAKDTLADLTKTIDISSEQVVNAVFPEYTFATEGTYHFILSTPNDMNNGNNTVEKDVVIYKAGTLLNESFETPGAVFSSDGYNVYTVPAGWTTNYVNVGLSNDFPTWIGASGIGHSGNYSAAQFVHGGGDAYLVSPNLNIPANSHYRMTFWYLDDRSKQNQSIPYTKGNEKDLSTSTYMNVKISTNPTQDNFDAFTDVAGKVIAVDGSWKKLIVDLSPWAGQWIYVAIASDYENYQWIVDDVIIDPSPENDLGISGITFSADPQYHTSTNVEIHVHNYGSISQTATVSYTSDDGKGTGKTSVTVAPGETQTASTAWIPLSNPGDIVNITGTISNSGDSETANDTAKVSVTIKSAGSLITVLDETFDPGWDANWTVVQDDPSVVGCTWVDDNPKPRTINPPVSAPFVIVDDDNAGSGKNASGDLISPMVDCSNLNKVYLSYDHYFHALTGSKGDVYIKSGATKGDWIKIVEYTTSSANAASEELNITQYAAHQSDVQVKFRYDDGGKWAWYWALDNVKIFARSFQADLAIYSIDQPEMDFIPRNQPLTIGTMLYNNGTEDQKLNKFATKSNIPVAFMITSHTDTVFTDTTIVASLSAGDSVMVNPTNTWTVPDTLDGVYKITAKILYNLDQNPNNNYIDKDVTTKYYKEAEVVSINQPAIILNNSTYTVKATIKNNGTYTIPTGTAITLTISLAKEEVFTETLNLDTEILYTDELEVAFADWTTGPHIGATYNINVTIDLTADEVTDNNSKSINLVTLANTLVYEETALNWIDADGGNGGTDVYAKDHDDNLSSEIRPTLGEFTFYGTPYSSLKVSSNGWMTFDASTTTSAAGNTSIPNAGVPNAILAPYWDDLRTYDADGGGIYYKEIGNKLVIEWYKIARYGHAGTVNTFEAILDYSDMSITFSYNNMNASGNDTYTIGIENADGTKGIQYAYYNANHDPSELQGTSIKFYSSDPSCLAPADLYTHNTGYGTSATIEWTKNVEEDLQGYYLYYKDITTKGSTNYKYVEKDVTLPYTLDGLTENSTYEIWVTAYDGRSESAESEHQTVLVEMVPPSQPIVSLSATEPTEADQGTTAIISWAKSPDDGSKTAVASYRIYRSLTEEGNYTLIGSVTATGDSSYSYTDNTLSPLVTYYYIVTAYNGYNDSDNNPGTSVLVHDEIAPASPSSVGVSDYPEDQGGKLIITWTLSTDDAAATKISKIVKTRKVMKLGKSGANDVASYEIYRSTDATFGDTPYATVNGGVSEYVDENATVTDTFYYMVKAKDSENLSVASTHTSGCSVDNIAPDRPTNLYVKDHPFDDGSAIDLEWTASADDPAYGKNIKTGIDDVIGYYIYRSKGNNTNFVKIADIPLANGKTYTYTDDLSTSDAAFDTLDIGNTEYFYYVQAHDTNLDNPSISSNQGSAIPRNNLLAPLPPTNLTAMDRPNDQGGAIKLHWTLSTDDNNTAFGIVSKYNIYRSGLLTKDNNYELIATVDRQTNIYWDTDENLIIGNSYTYKVTSAKVIEGQTFESDLETSNEAMAENIDNIAPAAPISLLANDKINDNGGVIELQWILSKDDPNANKNLKTIRKNINSGAADVVCYRVFRRDNFYGSYNQIAELPAGTCTYSDTTVTDAHTYYYKVKAYDKMNASNYSNAAFGRATDNIAPQAPTQLTAEYTTGNDTVNIAWTKSADDGTGYGDVCKYYLYRSISRYGYYQLIATLEPGTEEYTDINTIETNVYYKLRTFDGTNYSAYSNIASPVSPQPGDDIAPLPVSSFAVTDSVNKIVLAWILSPDDPYNYISKGGYNDVLYYIVHKVASDGTTSDFIVPKGINTYTDNNVVIGSAYTYCIKAFDGTNYSENNPQITVTIIGSTPEPPTNVRALISGHIAIIRWSFSADESNGTIAKYNIYVASEGDDFSADPTGTADAGVTQWISSELTAGTYHAGVQSVDIHGNVSAIVEVTFHIYSKNVVTSASPNPFNPTTTISYTLPQNAFVKLVIYNTTGQIINVLENTRKTAGEHNIKWTGKDSKGNIVSSGLYFYKLTIDHQTIVHKLLLMK